MGTQEGLAQAAEEQTLAAGTVLSVYYRVVKLVGPASFGTLYVGEHIQMKSRVAIRVLSAQWKNWIRGEEDIERLKQGDVLEASFVEFAGSSPELYEAIIAERCPSASREEWTKITSTSEM